MFSYELKTIIYSSIKNKKYPLINNILLNIINDDKEIAEMFFKKDITKIKSLTLKNEKKLKEENKNKNSDLNKDERDDLNALFRDMLEFKKESGDNDDINSEDFVYFVLVHSIINGLDEILEKNKKIQKFEDEYTQKQVEAINKINDIEIKNLISMAKERYEQEEETAENSSELNLEKSHISLFTRNLNKAHKTKPFQKIIGRKEEIKSIIRSLSRKQKNNPILVGDSGVGKTALVEWLAALIEDKKINEGGSAELINKQILSLDLTALAAGSKYRGEFEERFKNLLNEITEENKYILFIDDIHSILGTSQSNQNSFNLVGMIKPYILRGDFKVIGTTGFNEYTNIIEKDLSFSRLFSKIRLEKSTEEESIDIVKGIIKSYSDYHNVEYTEKAIIAAVHLSERYINDKFLPDKAIDIIDEAGVLASESKTPIITEQIIEELIKTKIGIQTSGTSVKDEEILVNLSENLKKEVFGQDEAIEKITDVLLVSDSGLNDDNKPKGVFLFLGSTGVGKTELSKQLAKESNMELIRIDMSEYTDKASLSKLIGTSAGYVGYGDGGKLTNAVRDNPHSIILLDELEKADPIVFNILLQIFDNGFVSDGSGRNVDFRHSTIIMTSNAGLNEENSKSLGFHDSNDSNKYSINVEKYFPLEFLNRIDEIINFNYMDEKICTKIIKYKLNKLSKKLKEKNIEFLYKKNIVNYMLKNGFNKKMGARPLERIINKEIKTLIAKKIISSKSNNINKLEIYIEDEKIHLK